MFARQIEGRERGEQYANRDEAKPRLFCPLSLHFSRRCSWIRQNSEWHRELSELWRVQLRTCCREISRAREKCGLGSFEVARFSRVRLRMRHSVWRARQALPHATTASLSGRWSPRDSPCRGYCGIIAATLVRGDSPSRKPASSICRLDTSFTNAMQALPAASKSP